MRVLGRMAPLLLSAAVALTTPHVAMACSSVQLSAADGSSVVARTMDFPYDLQDAVYLSPRGTKVQSLNPDGTPGLAFTTKYSSFAITAMHVKQAAADAMNEKGLTLAAQWLQASSYPTTVPADRKAVALSVSDIAAWLLGQFATVDEVKAGLADVSIWAAPIKQLENQLPSLYFVMFDATGKGIVIEFLDGKLVVQDNPVGVATNDPTFDWQLTNLQNFVGISGVNTNERRLGNLDVKTHASGNGLIGLPGDTMPSSRFIRLVINRNNIVKPADAPAAVAAVAHLINGVDVAEGTVRLSAAPDSPLETTRYTSLRDQSRGIYYIRPVASESFFRIDLTKLWNLQSIPEISVVDLMKSGKSDVTDLLVK